MNTIPRWEDRAASFGSVAEVYEQYRPGYPAEAVAWLVGGRPADVLDLGAGTGKLTRALVAADLRVVAVEPSPPMLDVLEAALPNVDARAGSAEAIPAAGSAFDVVVVAQAFHWFDQATAVPEIARVLRPGGRLALVWNLRDELVQWVHELWAVVAPEEPQLIGDVILPPGSPFGPMEVATFRQTQRLDRDAVLGLARSRSYVAAQPAERRAELLEAAAVVIDRHLGSDGLTLPYVTYCYRSRRD